MAKHRILVIGAAGKSGTPIVEQAIARGDEVSAFVRHPEKAGHLPKAATIVQGDGLDAIAVARAVQGHDTVIVTVGDAKTYVSGPVTRNAVAAMKAAGARRIIVLAAYGVGDSAHGLYGFVMSRLIGKLNADKLDCEAALEQSGLDWTAVRAPVLGEGPATGKLQSTLDGRINGFKAISRQDLAAFMLDQIDSPAFVKRKPIVYQG
jgi:uncharacterized protein YbjT (DUF2867 family)